MVVGILLALSFFQKFSLFFSLSAATVSKKRMLSVRGNNPSIGGRWFGAIVLSAHQAEQVVVGSSMKKLYTRTALPGLGQHEVVPGDGGVWRYRPPVPTRGRVGPF